MSPIPSSSINTFSQYQQKHAEMKSRHPSGAGESQRDLPCDNRVGLPRSNGRGDQYSGGHGQVPLPPPQALGNAMQLSGIMHPEPQHAPQASGNFTNSSSTVYYEPQPPPPSANQHTGLIYSPLNDCGTQMAVLNSIAYAPSRLKLRC